MEMMDRTTDRVRRLKACVASDPRLVAELAIWRLSLPLLKRVVSVERLAGFMAPRAKDPLTDAQRRERVDIVHRVVRTGGRMLMSPNCLERSLVLYRVLSRAGAQVALVLGMRRDGSALAGHSWVELDGRSLDAAANDRYTPIVTFRAQRGASARIDRVAAGVLPPL